MHQLGFFFRSSDNKYLKKKKRRREEEKRGGALPSRRVRRRSQEPRAGFSFVPVRYPPSSFLVRTGTVRTVQRTGRETTSPTPFSYFNKYNNNNNKYKLNNNNNTLSTESSISGLRFVRHDGWTMFFARVCQMENFVIVSVASGRFCFCFCFPKK